MKKWKKSEVECVNTDDKARKKKYVKSVEKDQENQEYQTTDHTDHRSFAYFFVLKKMKSILPFRLTFERNVMKWENLKMEKFDCHVCMCGLLLCLSECWCQI